jgi:hypothetical protein
MKEGQPAKCSHDLSSTGGRIRQDSEKKTASEAHSPPVEHRGEHSKQVSERDLANERYSRAVQRRVNDKL